MISPLSLEPLTSGGEYVSLFLIVIGMVVLGAAAARVKVLRSLQVEMFIFALILASSEIPHILETLGAFGNSPLETIGLEVHSVSMVVLVLFVTLRVYSFLRRTQGA